MPNVRPLNKKKYGISKHAFGTAYSYCLQYPEWREELGSRTSTVKSPQITGMPGAHSGSDATANLEGKWTAKVAGFVLLDWTRRRKRRNNSTGINSTGI